MHRNYPHYSGKYFPPFSVILDLDVDPESSRSSRSALSEIRHSPPTLSRAALLPNGISGFTFEDRCPQVVGDLSWSAKTLRQGLTHRAASRALQGLGLGRSVLGGLIRTGGAETNTRILASARTRRTGPSRRVSPLALRAATGSCPGLRLRASSTPSPESQHELFSAVSSPLPSRPIDALPALGAPMRRIDEAISQPDEC